MTTTSPIGGAQVSEVREIATPAAGPAEMDWATQRVLDVRRRVGVLCDTLLGGSGVSSEVLAELSDFIATEALPAARAYEEAGRRPVGWGSPACPGQCWASDLTCPDTASFDTLAEELERCGYVPCVNRFDAAAVGGLLCVCGRLLAYRGMRRGPSHRVFGVCPTCVHWTEL